MSLRDRLPDRRACEQIGFSFQGMDYVLGVGRYGDGRIGEMFLDAGKLGSALETATRDGAIVLSIALQHGVPLATLRAAVLRDETGAPMTAIGRALDLMGE